MTFPARLTQNKLQGLHSLLLQISGGMESAVTRLQPALTATNSTLAPTEVPGLFTITGEPQILTGLMDTFSSVAYVRYAQPEQILHVNLTPNDPSFTNNTLYGLSGGNGIQAPAAWDLTTGSTAVTIANIDTGLDYRHPDLYKNVWINQAEIPLSRKANVVDKDGDQLITFWDLNDPQNQGLFKISDVNVDGRIDGLDVLAPLQADGSGGWANGVSEDGDTAHVDDLIGWNFVANTNNPMDDHGHGTHTGGTIAAIGNNGTGVVGVNWKAQLMPLKFLNASGNGSDAAAIRYAADHGARVSSNSWGGSGGGATLFNAISYAGGKGQVFVAAAGNDGLDNEGTPFYPASYTLSNIIAVAATDSAGNLASFSNYGATSASSSLSFRVARTDSSDVSRL